MFTESESFKRAHIGIHIIDVDTGEEVYSKNAEQFFTVASLQKIPLSVVAISDLGGKYSFKTDLEYDGTVDQKGVLHGNIWIKGGGDPTLSLDVFSKWYEELAREGIHKVDGKIIIDASSFETTLASPYWHFQDLGNYYGAGASSLSINQNLYKVTFKPGIKEGDPATVLQIEPTIPGLVIHNEVTTGPAGSGDKVFIYGSEYSPIQFYRGTVPIDEPTLTIKGSIPDPSHFCAATLSTKIEARQGIEVRRQPLDSTPRRKIISSTSSPSLHDIVKDMNQFSVNIYAEHILKAIGNGKADEGSKKIEKFLENLGVPSQMHDGSGLSRTNLLTPKGFTTLLQEIRKNPLYQSVYDSFPEAGKPGTLQSFPLPSHAALRAKTGSMRNIYNLGGYLTLDSGKEYALCIFFNNYPGSAQEVRKQIPLFLHEFIEMIVTK
ncbi:MAG: D-alanyl-D-alanine carboxypeptidase/D-alanyl-D-alanine-endopeptidase [Chlamydiae bacterium]|nr:D-alanyl-D-alanine carboxypeptidase/D-alanyl-D-alanine-endopeptidase [Chlamydiota bacterium]